MHLLVNEMLEYQNAWCNDKNYRLIYFSSIVIMHLNLIQGNESCAFKYISN